MTSAGPGPFRLPPHWLRGAAGFVAVAVAIYLTGIVFSGAGDSLAAMQRLGLPMVLLGTSLASTAYLVRFARWQWLITRLGARVPPLFNLRVYMAGLALTSSPGKVGETLRSALLLDRGVKVGQSLAAFLADRGSDVIGMAFLGAAAAFLAQAREPVLEAIALVLLVATGAFALAIRRRVFAWPDGRSAGALARRVRSLGTPLAPWGALWTPLASIGYSFLAVIAYGVQAFVLALYVQSLGADLATATCIKIFAVAMLLGAATMAPGGLGATEVALVYQLSEAGMPMPEAVAAAVMLRLSTLWFAMLLGVAALMTFTGRNRN